MMTNLAFNYLRQSCQICQNKVDEEKGRFTVIHVSTEKKMKILGSEEFYFNDSLMYRYLYLGSGNIQRGWNTRHGDVLPDRGVGFQKGE